MWLMRKQKEWRTGKDGIGIFFFFCNNVLLKKSGKFLKYSETKVKNKAVLYFPPIKTLIAEFQLKTNDSWCW